MKRTSDFLYIKSHEVPNTVCTVVVAMRTAAHRTETALSILNYRPMVCILPDYLSISSLALLVVVSRDLRAVYGAATVWDRRQSEWIQAGDQIKHLSSHYRGLRPYACTVIEVSGMTLKTDLVWKPELTGWDRVHKADWAFYK